jgi:hypothetical protein
MAYTSKTLSVLGYANGFTLWHYKHKDSLAAIKADGYFNPGAEMLRPGDFILTNAGDETDAPEHSVLVVATNKNGNVTLISAA